MEKLLPASVRARAQRAKPTFLTLGIYLVCQIAGKNSAEFKNYVKNRFGGPAGVRRARKSNILSTMN